MDPNLSLLNNITTIKTTILITDYQHEIKTKITSNIKSKLKQTFSF
jgi:hypothetical protein